MPSKTRFSTTTVAERRGREELIINGANRTEISTMFKIDAKKVATRLHNVRPIGGTPASPLFSVRDAASVLMDPPPDMVDRILRMHHNDLPKLLAKEYWNGQLARLNYQERKGDLWRTAKVIELVAETNKNLRMSLMLLTDAVEREMGLTDRQRETITRLVDGALTEARERLINAFENRRVDPLSGSGSPDENDEAEGL